MQMDAKETIQSQLKKEDGLFNSLESIPKSIGNNSTRNNKVAGKFKVYTIHSLSELVDEVRKTSSKEKPIVLRYLLTPNYELLFAREGLPNSYIPPHFAMTNEGQQAAAAITAGNIKINKNGEIVFFSNKSGDFWPSWDSLQCGISAMLACDLVIADTIQIEKFDDGKPMGVTNYTLESVKEALSGLPVLIQKEQFQAANKNLETRVNTYPKDKEYPAEQKSFSANLVSCKGKLRFTDDSNLTKSLFSGPDYVAVGAPTQSNLTTGQTFFSNKIPLVKKLFSDTDDCLVNSVVDKQDESEDSYDLW